MGGLRLEAIGLGTLVRGTGVHDGLCIVHRVEGPCERACRIGCGERERDGGESITGGPS